MDRILRGLYQVHMHTDLVQLADLARFADWCLSFKAPYAHNGGN